MPVSTNCVGNHPWISRFRSHLTHLKPIWQYYTFTHYCTCWHAFRLYQNLVHLAHRLSGIVCLQLFPGPQSGKIWTANQDKRKVRSYVVKVSSEGSDLPLKVFGMTFDCKQLEKWQVVIVFVWFFYCLVSILLVRGNLVQVRKTEFS